MHMAVTAECDYENFVSCSCFRSVENCSLIFSAFFDSLSLYGAGGAIAMLIGLVVSPIDFFVACEKSSQMSLLSL